MKKSLFVLFLLGMPILAFPFFVLAEGYDIYVDASYAGDDADGSQDKPYKKLSEAAEDASGSQKVYLKNGEYEKATFGGSVKIVGQSKKAVIKGTLTLSGNNQLKNITVSGGSPAISIGKNADVTISDCEIENFSFIGIQALPGSGRLTLENSNVHGRGGKGVYVQEGRKIDIIDNQIHDTGGEGLDIRGRVSGRVSGNSIYGNSESGIEFVTGSSEISIFGNSIRSNGASGIASQFYSQTSKVGKITIRGNLLSKNKKYGLDCAIPSGGEPSSQYWGDSIELLDNTIEGNKMNPINAYCNMIQAVDAEKEKKDNRISEAVEENLTESIAPQENMIIVEEEKIIELEKIPEETLSNSIKAITSRSKIKTFFFGPDYKNIKTAASELEQIKNSRLELFNLLKEADNPVDKKVIRERIGEISDVMNVNKNILAEQEKKFSFFGKFVEEALFLSEKYNIVAVF